MDPLSVTLAVVTLATALKDIIETAQIIQDLFSKLPQNYRNAQRLATEVLKTLRGMQEIYQEHDQTFNKSKSLKKAITDLETYAYFREMKSVHEQCARLIPPVSERRRDRFKMAFYSFWNRAKVDTLLLELRNHVNRCSHDFQLLSSLRTEAHIVEIHETIIQSTSHRSAIVHGHNNFDNTSMSYNALGCVSNPQLFAFSQTTTMPMTWIANSIPAHDLSNAYLRREVGKVDLSFRSILTRWSQNLPADVEFRASATSWHLGRLPVSSVLVHQAAVVLAFSLQSLLRDPPSNSWFDQVDYAMNSLTVKLDDLGLYKDAIVLGSLRVDLWRVITRQHPSRKSSLGLVQALSRVGGISSNMGNRSQAYSSSEEAIKILQSLAAAPGAVVQLKKDNIILMAKHILKQAINEPHSDRSLKVQLAVDAGKMLESVLGITGLLSGTNVSSPSNWVIISNSKEVSDDDYFTYAHSLLRIAKIRSSSSLESRELAKSALEILNRLLSKYPGSDKVQNELINVLTYLSGLVMCATDSRAVTEGLKYVQQKATLLRHLTPFDPQRYVLRLARTLWLLRRCFLFLGRSTEAESIYQDLIGLKDLAVAPPHSDIQIPSETEGAYYTQLAQYHYEAKHFTDSVYAAQNAISQCAALEFMDSRQDREKHIGALALLCKSLSAASQYNAALSEGDKAINMIDNLSTHVSGSNLVESYVDVLCAMMDSLVASPHHGAFMQAQGINTRIQKLVRSGKIKPKQKKLVQCLVTYARVLQKNDRIEEAVIYLREIHNKWRDMFSGGVDDNEVMFEYLNSLRTLSNTFWTKAELDMALHYNEEAIAFVTKKLRNARAPNVTIFTIWRYLNADHIRLLRSGSRYPEALELYSLSQLTVASIRGVFWIDPTECTVAIIDALAELALTQLENCIPDDAIATATKALSLLQNVPFGDFREGFRLQCSCLLSLSHGLHDIGEVEGALNRLDEAENMAQKLDSVNSVEEAHEWLDGALLYARSTLLFTKGDCAEAFKLMKRAKVIQKESSKRKKFLLQDLAITLSYSGVLYCTLGKHEEGLATAIELATLKENIRVISPAFSRGMDIKFDYLARRGAWKAVQEAKNKLECTHQNE